MRWRVLAAISLCACAAATEFTVSDPTYRPHQAAAPPEVFTDRRPPRPYRVVGVVHGPAARAKGREVGCDLLVTREIHLLYHGGRVRVTRVAQAGTRYNLQNPGGTFGERESGTESFICGVYLGQE
jgi:hypothetical protein